MSIYSDTDRPSPGQVWEDRGARCTVLAVDADGWATVAMESGSYKIPVPPSYFERARLVSESETM